MIGRMQKLRATVVTMAMVLAAFLVMASDISRDEVVACAGSDQEVDVGETVTLDGSCSTGVGTLTYKWFFGDGEIGFGAIQTHLYEGMGPSPSGDEEGIYFATLVVKDSNNVFDLDTVRVTVKNHYPNAFAGPDRIVNEDDTVSFDSSGFTDVDDGGNVAIHWDFGDGTSQDSAAYAMVDHVFEKAGAYAVTLTVTDDDGAFGQDVAFVTVNNVVPSAEGLADGELDDDLTITEDDTISFDASGSVDTPSDMPSLSYGWDYGDGSKAVGVTATHTYTKQGTYLVMLTVADDDGAVDQDAIIVRVLNAPPVADAGPDQTVDEGDTVFFDATGSSDTLSDRPILEYSWSFGDGGTLPTHGWYDDSVNGVDLTVEDDDGLQDTDSMTVVVENVPPVAGIDGVYVPVDLTLRVSGEKWHNVIVTLSDTYFERSIIEIFRTPGSPNDQSKTAEDVHIDIAEVGTLIVSYTPLDDPVNGNLNGASPVWLTMAFEDGVSYTLYKEFNVQQPEDWVWTHDMNAHVAGHPIHVEGSVYDPGQDNIRVEWDFGDGTAPIITNYLSNGNHPMRISEDYVRTFPLGASTVTLEATDDDGAMATMSVTITHTDHLTCTNVAPRASSTGGRTVVEDDEVALAGTGMDTGSDQGILTYTWDMGDGTIFNTPTVSHAYAKSGTYYPTLVVVDDEGAVGITSERVEVLNVVPTASAMADRLIVAEDDVINFDAYATSDTPTDLSMMQYAWDYGDGSKGFGIDTTHVYSKAGTYQVVLTATDDNGAASTSVLTVDVQNVAPHDIAITAKDIVDEDEVMFYEGSIEDTPSDVPLLAFSWSFGDGFTGLGRNPTHAYSTPGDYVTRLTVTDDDMTYAEQEFHVTVNNVVPVAYGGLSKNLYGPQMLVSFDGRGFDSPTDQSTLTYGWDFGDGDTSASASAFHLYATDTSGTYTASLMVTDMHGASDTVYVTVNVKVDSDGDQLLDGGELDIGTDPFDFDTDDDWLIDSDELNPPLGKPSTDPRKADVDRDGCTDWEEIWPGRDGFITDPSDPDMDSDTLKDCEEVFAKTYKSTDRFLIGSYATASGAVDVGLGGVRSSSPTSQIITAEAKLGISHTSIGELKITLSNGARSIVLRDRVGGTADNLFLSYDLFSVGFPASDFGTSRTWTLNVDDQVSSSERGFVEYFEIYMMTATNPMRSDTDSDGLSDGEETSPGSDGWLTDPWKSDSDGDQISDYRESKGWKRFTSRLVYQANDGFKTDPTRSDTDRDGVDDYNDWDPLNDLMIEVDIGDFSPRDDDTGTPYDDTEVFIGISVGIYDYDEGKTLWTDRRTVAEDTTRDLNRQYTFEVSDSTRYHPIIISAWDDDDVTDDDVLDIYFGYPNAWLINYDLIQSTPNEAYDDAVCYWDSSGEGDGYDTDEDAELEWCIRTVRPQRVTTYLLNSLDSESLHTADDGKLRFAGEQEFYFVLLDLGWGYNAIIVPRAVFVDSRLNWVLENSAYSPYLWGMAFSANDESSSWTSGSLAGTLRGSVSGSDRDDILWQLAHDESGAEIAQVSVVTDQLLTLNLETYLLNLIPFSWVEFDSTGEDPDGFFESAGEFFVSVVEAIGDFFIAIFDFVVRWVDFLIEIGMWVISRIIDAISAVVDAIIFVAEILLDFVVGLVDWVVDLVVSELLPLLKSAVILVLGAIGGPVFEWLGEAIVGRIFDSLGYVLTWIAEDFLPGVADIIIGALNAGAALIDIVTGFATCVGDLTLAAFGDSTDGACREVLEALKEFGYAVADILVSALELAGTALATAFTIALDWCGVLGSARSLTAGEVALAEPIFGSSIDLSQVRLADATLCTDVIGFIQGLFGQKRPFTTGYVITITDLGTWSDAVLVHELTHVWQYEQNGMDYVLNSIVDQASEADAYNYGYDDAYDGDGGEEELNAANGDIDAFNVEQQAQIIEHYYVRRYVEGLSPAEYAAWQPYADIVYEP